MKKVSECLDYLVETDDEYGRLKGELKGLEHRLKATKGVAFIEAKGQGNNEERKAVVESCGDVMTMVEILENKYIEMETIAAKRKTCELIIEVWRSQNANKRVGNI